VIIELDGCTTSDPTITAATNSSPRPMPIFAKVLPGISSRNDGLSCWVTLLLEWYKEMFGKKNAVGISSSLHCHAQSGRAPASITRWAVPSTSPTSQSIPRARSGMRGAP
jgi:hypothetical protein